VLDIDVQVLKAEEGPAMGGAMLAAVACGEYANVEAAAEKIVAVVEVIQPEKELVEKYEAKYQKFRKIYPSCKALFDELHI
jgi:xylulokinase